MASPQTIGCSNLDTLPTDLLLIILGYLDTAQSLAHLAATCKGLHQLVSVEGWRIFVRSCFSSLKLPSIGPNEGWADLARVLTAQSRDWDRRAFIFHSLSPPDARQLTQRRTQSIPGNVILDAHMQRRGNLDDEIVVWGSGEDIFARIRQSDRTTVISESWHRCEGQEFDFVAGKDDTTALSIVKPQMPNEHEDLGVVVGRASGDLRWLAINDTHFGRTIMHFRPSLSSSVRQDEIQAVDIDHDSGMIIAGTKEGVLLYPTPVHDRTSSDEIFEPSCINPVTAMSLKDVQPSSPFEFIRSAKMLSKTTAVVALNRSFDPIRILEIVPTGLVGSVSTPPKAPDEHPYISSSPRTVRTLLPVDARSAMSGGGKVLLSSWDDGTIRLQDLRTPSPVDCIYQDNFEVSTPINALISHGLERFIAGSAYSHMLKVFDFRWTKGYYHTDSLPCGNLAPYPAPRPPTIVDEPKYKDDRQQCNHQLNRLCRWHALSRHDFYRPNCNIYLPFRNYASSPIYTLAKPSDFSPTIYAGLSGLLVEFTLKSGIHTTSTSSTTPLYIQRRGKVAVLETGDGSAISDISKCQRVPEIRRQSFRDSEHHDLMARKRHRLDEALQAHYEWQEV